MMRLFKILTTMALVLVFSATASAAIVRTVPFPGYLVADGSAHCAATNAGTTPGNATLVLYDNNGTALSTDPFTAVAANVTVRGVPLSLVAANATFCECTVPNTTNWRCSFVYLDFLADGSTRVMVIEAK